MHDEATNVRVLTNRQGEAFDTFAYHTTTRDALYYAYDPRLPVGRRTVSSATDGQKRHTVSIFEDGTVTVAHPLNIRDNESVGAVVSIDVRGTARAYRGGRLTTTCTLADDPQLTWAVEEGYIDRDCADDVICAHRWGDLTHLSFVMRAFPAQRIGNDGAACTAGGETPRARLPLLLVAVGHE